MVSESGWPSTPPLALMSLTASLAPRFICSPNAAYWPVMGPATAIRTSACAVPTLPAAARAATTQRPRTGAMSPPLESPWREYGVTLGLDHHHREHRPDLPGPRRH